jgi:hypothetical protein
MWVAMRQLAYGVSADALVEFGRLTESTKLLTVKKFAEGVVCKFEAEWLRLQKIDEMAVIERHFRALGFPGLHRLRGLRLMELGHVPLWLAGPP